MSLLKAFNLSKAYHGKTVVQDVSIQINPGEIVGLLGPNGAGKTTAFYMIMGLQKCDGGKIYFKGEEITHLPIYKRARMGMGYLAQEPSIFRQMTVQQNLEVIFETLPIPKKQQLEELMQLLVEFRLEHLKDKPSPTLSGGERRRLEIARTLIQKPSLLLLDEPFAAIDPVTIDELKELIVSLTKKNISFLITDHNVREIFKIANRCYLVQKGAVTHEDTPKNLSSNLDVVSSYLGQAFSF